MNRQYATKEDLHQLEAKIDTLVEALENLIPDTAQRQPAVPLNAPPARPRTHHRTQQADASALAEDHEVEFGEEPKEKSSKAERDSDEESKDGEMPARVPEIVRRSDRPFDRKERERASRTRSPTPIKPPPRKRTRAEFLESLELLDDKEKFKVCKLEQK